MGIVSDSAINTTPTDNDAPTVGPLGDAFPRAQPNAVASAGSGGHGFPSLGQIGSVFGGLPAALTARGGGPRPDGGAEPGASYQPVVQPSALAPRQQANDSGTGSPPAGTTDNDVAGSQGGNNPTPPTTGTAKPIDPTAGPVSAAVAGNAPSMTTEQANAYYGAQRAAMQAKETQGQQQGAVAQAAQGNAAATSWAQTQAEDRARVANNSSHGSGTPRAAREARQAADSAGVVARAAQTDLGKANAGVGIVNPVQDSIAQQRSIQEGQKQATLLPGEQAAQAAHTGLVTQQTGLAAKDNDLKSFQVQQASHMQDLTNKALNGDPEAQANLNTYRQIEKGEGGNLTQQQIGKLYTDYAGHLAITGVTPDPTTFMHGILQMSTLAKGGQTAQPPADWMARAKAANPGMSDEQIASNYKAK